MDQFVMTFSYALASLFFCVPFYRKGQVEGP